MIAHSSKDEPAGPDHDGDQDSLENAPEDEQRPREAPDELPREAPEEVRDAAEEPREEPLEELDLDSLGDKALDAVEFLEGLLDRMDLDAEVVQVQEGERIHIDLEGPDAGRVIGKKGQTLDSLQFLVNKAVNRFPEDRKHVVLDVEGYKDRRDDSLAAMAQRLADKASQTGKVISINPMPARERRVIHLALADTPGVTTCSDGEGTDRRVRIVPENARRRSNRR